MRPWFAQHDPQISWHTGEVLKWGHQCFPTCFPYIPRPAPHPIKTLALNSNSIESPLVKQSVNIPTCYAPFRDVFCPQRASQLPPHRPWDCAIYLVSGEPVPRGKIYPLSLAEQKAMEEYIEEALQQGYIHPSTSPAASSFTLMTSSFTLEGNRQLLAIKLPLEEWRHWLEGSQHPFTVLTDHKNLQYLREAKRLNPRQARWALFFTRFNYTISYRPGPKNTKADALSRLHTPEESEVEPEPIIHETLIVCPIQWNPDTNTSFNASTATPPGCPQGYSMSNSAHSPHPPCTCIPGHWSPRGQQHPLAAEKPLLVAKHGQGCQKVHSRLYGLRHFEKPSPLTSRQAPPVARSQPAMVTPGGRFHH